MDDTGWLIVIVAVFQVVFGVYLGWLMWGRKAREWKRLGRGVTFTDVTDYRGIAGR